MKLNLRFQTCGQDELPRKDKFDRYVFHLEITIPSDFATESQTSGVAFRSDNTSTTDISQESSIEKELTGMHKFHLWISLKSQFLQMLPQKDKQVGWLLKVTTLQQLTLARKAH